MKAMIGAVGTFFGAVLDAVLPLRARSARTRARGIEDIPLWPRTHNLLGTSIVTLADYRSRPVEDLVRSLKYDASSHAARLAAELLADYLREEIASHRLFSKKRILLVPIPLSHARERERGFNQIDRVLHALPRDFLRETGAEIRRDLLARIRATEQQTRLSRSERLTNVAGAFALLSNEKLSHAHVFLIDDVTTTGATLVNAATPLRRAGAEVSLIAIARA